MPIKNKIILSPLRLDEIKLLGEWINDRELVHLSSPYKPISEIQQETWFKSIQARNDIVIFGIRFLETDELIGSCQLHDIHPIHHSAELQIRIGNRKYWGKGHGTESVKLLLDFAFNDLNLHRIYLNVLKTNESAYKLYKTVGFVQEGIARKAAYINGKFIDLIQMGILHSEFK